MHKMMLLFISALPVVLIGIYIYKRDKNKEPLVLLLKLFVSGFFSCYLTLSITDVLGPFIPLITENYNNQTLLELIIHAFVGVALIEEFSKWLMVYIISYNNKEFDELYDIIIYSVFVALGFAFFENLFYVFDNGFSIGILRAIISVPSHVCDGVFMGYYLGLAKLSTYNNNNILRQKNLILSLLVPIILHGIFDYLLFTGSIIFLVIFFIFVIILFKISLSKIKKISSINSTLTHNN